MAANKQQIELWLKRDDAAGNDYMLVVHDTFSGDDYPAYVSKGELEQSIVQYSGEMQKVMEVYDLSLDIPAQLEEYQAWHT